MHTTAAGREGGEKEGKGGSEGGRGRGRKGRDSCRGITCIFTILFLTPSHSHTITPSQEGLGPQKLDKYSKGFGFPVGMATLADEVGIDVAAHVAEDLNKVFGQRYTRVPS